MKKILVLSIIFILIAGFSFAGGEEETADGVKVRTAKIASEEIEGDFMTVWANNFGDEMRDYTDGALDFTVYPYGTIGDTRDINELAQLGVVEGVYTDFAWISAFVPEVQVLALHYLWPKEKMPQVLEWVVKNGKFMPFLEEKFRAKGLVPLGIVYEGWQWMTGQDPVTKMADLKGVKTRVMGSKLLVEDYRAYGMSPTPMSYGEVYSALQTGLIDAQVNPLFANYSMKFFEVTEYFTQFWAEPFLGIPTLNKQFYDSLDADVQQKMKDYWADTIVPSAEWIDDLNAKDKKLIQEEKPSIVFHELDDAAIAELKEAAKTVVPVYLDVVGDEAQMILDLLLADIEAGKAAVGVK
ncbi:MAG: TRAP transporter substrate-binding protein DctP [Spirochaetia bacterium]|jgi:TRAP-type C4-dicarboxylate transport system substrate-binding protein|nr:TRAP transporter substrate-binding protein DctP [Spirochaetia bacterium]